MVNNEMPRTMNQTKPGPLGVWGQWLHRRAHHNLLCISPRPHHQLPLARALLLDAFMCMCTYGCFPQLLPVLFFERVSWRTWSSLILDSLASKPPQSSCFFLLNAGVTGAWFFVGSVRTRSPCLHSKHLSFSLSCCFLITTKAWFWRRALEGSSQGRGLTTRWNFPA